ncbi:MAG: hypothetical protein ACYC2G_05690, partial [Gemmatimonadaceae bacterium]
MKQLSPRATYQAEKEKAERERRLSHAELMAEAQAEFDKMLADARSARKSGRPKKNVGNVKPIARPPEEMLAEASAASLAAAPVASAAPEAPAARTTAPAVVAAPAA